MTGTDSTQDPITPSGGPAIVLVEPQLAENIGTTSRAMYNCGLTDLRLVNPRQDWLSSKALAASSGATNVLEAAQVYQSLEEAIADLEFVAIVDKMVASVFTADAVVVETCSFVVVSVEIGTMMVFVTSC